VKTIFYKFSNLGRNESTPQAQSNVSWISSQADLEISFMKTRLEMLVWESGRKIDRATGVKMCKARFQNTVQRAVLRNFENITFVARQRKHFVRPRGLGVFLLLNSLTKRTLSFGIQVCTCMLLESTGVVSVEQRALMCPFDQSI